MLTRLLYVSTAVTPVTTAVTGTILRSAQAFNAANGITGVLCQGQGVFLQVLEGRRTEVNALYARIAQDKRHKNVQLLAIEDIAQRRYGAWAMGHVDLTNSHAKLTLNTSGAEFDPYTATGERILAQIDALIAAGKVMTTPVV